MKLHRVLAYLEPARYLLVWQALAEQLQHLRSREVERFIKSWLSSTVATPARGPSNCLT